jgi:hypothetical protein
MSNTKPSNPKDAFGIRKVSISYVSLPVLAEVAVGMQEGGAKYGRHNYRVIGVKTSVYIDAAFRHIADFWEGEDIDASSGISHVSKAIASLVVLRDAMIQGQCVDDRPPPSPRGWLAPLNAKVEELAEKYPKPVPAYTAKNRRRIHRS